MGLEYELHFKTVEILRIAEKGADQLDKHDAQWCYFGTD